MFLQNRGDFLIKNNYLKLILLLILLVFCISTVYANTNNFINDYTSNRFVPIYKVDTEKNVVSITVDGAWGSNKTEELLKIFDKYNIKITFFFAGIWLEKNQDLVNKILDSGHKIENHSYSHRHLIELKEEEIIKEIEKTDKLIKKITGESPLFFRPPYGEYNNTLIKHARTNGYQVIQWSIDTHDWMNPGIDYIVDRISNNIDSGDILLFHNNAENIVKIMDIIIPKIQKQYNIIPLNNLIIKDEYQIRSFDGLQYNNSRGDDK